MTNISSANARAGYEIFRKSGCEASRADINATLKRMGYSAVSQRMYTHYNNLCREGFNRYISINRFDVARASRPYENLSSNSRYKYIDSSSGARVTFPRGRRLVEAFGRAERVGETGLILVFDDPPTVAALQAKSTRPRIGESVRIELLERGQQYDARVVDAERGKHVVLEVEFERLQSISEMLGREPLSLHSYRFEISGGRAAPATVDTVSRQLFYLFELIETSRSVVNEMAHASKDDRYAPVAEVRSLSMRSPLVVELGIPEAVAVVAGGAFTVLGLAVAYERWRKKRLENNGLEIDNGVKASKAELDSAVNSLRTDIVQALHDDFKLKQADAEKLENVEHLTTSIRNLAEQDVEEARLLPPHEVDQRR
jgi:hypothetical protein